MAERKAVVATSTFSWDRHRHVAVLPTSLCVCHGLLLFPKSFGFGQVYRCSESQCVHPVHRQSTGLQMAFTRCRFANRIAAKVAAGLVALVAIMPFSCIVFAAEDDAKHLPEVSFGSSLPNELADPLGARSALSRYGIVQTAIYTGEVFENISGGFAEGGHYHGLVDVATDIDMGTFIGWQGMSFHTNMYVTHGSSITADNVGTIAAVSHIEATPSIRLFEAWLDQSLLGGAASIRFGQLAIDAEFATLDTGGAFISSTFGWNTLMTDNLPNGGPIYPLAAPGVRVKVQPTAGLVLQAAIFNGDPVGDCEGDPQKCNDHGLEFRLKDPPLVMAELAYTHSLSLPGAIKIGSWISFDDFKDQRLSDDGRSQADPASSGEPRLYDENYGFYATIQQMLFQVPGSEDRGLTLFARVAASPEDRNQIDLYVEGGITLAGLINARPNDVMGIGLAYTHISDRASRLEQDTHFFNGTFGSVRSYETLLEISYTAEIMPGWSLQPDFQYYWNPGGHVPHPDDTDNARLLESTAILGLRTKVVY